MKKHKPKKLSEIIKKLRETYGLHVINGTQRGLGMGFIGGVRPGSSPKKKSKPDGTDEGAVKGND